MNSRAITKRTKGQTSDAVQAFEALVPHLRILVPLVVLAAAVAAGIVLGVPAAMLVLTGGALLLVIALFWASVRTLVGETPLSGADAYALGAPKQEEERKQAMLRALKDLEFERSVGKISEEDFQVLNRRYREEAKRLLRILDDEAQPRRQRAEELLAQRLEAEARGEAPVPARARRAAARAEKKPTPAEKAPAATEAAPADPEKSGRTSCSACGTKNETDAAFCKKCGERLGSSSENAQAAAPRRKSRKGGKRKKARS